MLGVTSQQRHDKPRIWLQPIKPSLEIFHYLFIIEEQDAILKHCWQVKSQFEDLISSAKKIAALKEMRDVLIARISYRKDKSLGRNMPTFRFKHLRQQWPVGHGFFHTALVQLDRETYRYVYDCGAETFETINSQINRYASNEAMEGRGNSIDMLVVSHFHNDHIKGLPHFLSLFNVKKLVIPYLEEDDKLVALAGLAAHGAETWTLLSGLLIEPREWLRTRSPDAELIEITKIKR